MKQAIIAILVVFAIVGGAVVFGKDKEAGAGSPSSNIYGNAESSVTLIEYGDFECPACGAFFPIFSELKEQYKDKIRFEFRHFPLVQIHQNAQAAHRAAEAAAKQGKFWEMHNLLYERQASWRSSGAVGPNGAPVASNNPTAIFESYAEEIGLDMEQFKIDAAAGETLATINADTALGKQDGVSGTPTFVLNGVKIDDTSSIDSVEKFSGLIEQALSDSGQSSSEPTSKPGETPEQ